MYQIYSYRKKNYKRLFLVLFAVCLTVVGGYYSFRSILDNRLPQEEESAILLNAQDRPLETKVAKEDFRYEEGAAFHVTYHYSCGHKKTEERRIPLSFIGKTFLELQEENPGYEFLDSTPQQLVANVIIAAQCDDHYIIQLSGETLTVYYKKSPGMVEREVPIHMETLYAEDIEILKNGIEVGSKTELLEFLEDFAE